MVQTTTTTQQPSGKTLEQLAQQRQQEQIYAAQLAKTTAAYNQQQQQVYANQQIKEETETPVHVITWSSGGYGSGTYRTMYLDGQRYGTIQIPESYKGREEEYIQNYASKYGYKTPSQVTAEQQTAAIEEARRIEAERHAGIVEYQQRQEQSRSRIAEGISRGEVKSTAEGVEKVRTGALTSGKEVGVEQAHTIQTFKTLEEAKKSEIEFAKTERPFAEKAREFLKNIGKGEGLGVEFAPGQEQRLRYIASFAPESVQSGRLPEYEYSTRVGVTPEQKKAEISAIDALNISGRGLSGFTQEEISRLPKENVKELIDVGLLEYKEKQTWEMPVVINPDTGKPYTEPDLDFQKNPAAYLGKEYWEGLTTAQKISAMIGGTFINPYGVGGNYLQIKFEEAYPNYKGFNIPIVSSLLRFDPSSAFKSVEIGGQIKEFKPISREMGAKEGFYTGIYETYASYADQPILERLSTYTYKSATGGGMTTALIATGAGAGVAALEIGATRYGLMSAARAGTLNRLIGIGATVVATGSVVVEASQGKVGSAATTAGLFVASLPFAIAGYRGVYNIEPINIGKIKVPKLLEKPVEVKTPSGEVIETLYKGKIYPGKINIGNVRGTTESYSGRNLLLNKRGGFDMPGERPEIFGGENPFEGFGDIASGVGKTVVGVGKNIIGYTEVGLGGAGISSTIVGLGESQVSTTKVGIGESQVSTTRVGIGESQVSTTKVYIFPKEKGYKYENIKDNLNRNLNENINQIVSGTLNKFNEKNIERNINKNALDIMNRNILKNLNRNIERNINKNIEEYVYETRYEFVRIPKPIIPKIPKIGLNLKFSEETYGARKPQQRISLKKKSVEVPYATVRSVFNIRGKRKEEIPTKGKKKKSVWHITGK